MSITPGEKAHLVLMIRVWLSDQNNIDARVRTLINLLTDEQQDSLYDQLHDERVTKIEEQQSQVGDAVTLTRSQRRKSRDP